MIPVFELGFRGPYRFFNLYNIGQVSVLFKSQANMQCFLSPQVAQYKPVKRLLLDVQLLVEYAQHSNACMLTE